MKINKTMNCLNENELGQYVDYLRGIGEEPAEEVIAHVTDCEKCKKAILEMSTIMDEVDANEVKEG
ncbi:MAG: hypothetical protein M0P69_18370 [Bacteroidales bacterium]|nr:hypothetical protein [Bacteroidales bacterium]MDD3812658.1 hypothetical protein [Bacteroidales bacterium]MDD4813686.1 hypothetical protein [Bacteroidales bacterium]